MVFSIGLLLSGGPLLSGIKGKVQKLTDFRVAVAFGELLLFEPHGRSKRDFVKKKSTLNVSQ